MIDSLERLVDEVSALQRQLILLIGTETGARDAILALSHRRSLPVLHVGQKLASRLAPLPIKQRALLAPEALRELADGHSKSDLLLLDNIELLFDCTLKVDPLKLLKMLAREQRVVAVWPGELSQDQLLYARRGHPEHQSYRLDGLIPFLIH